ncbi:MAG: hypothetical protein MUC51_17390, partial [Anaerolineae bacterium]|nr:hypothetical protein [Anaerolineae bacterium]
PNDACASRRSTLGSARRRSLWGAVASAIGHLTRKKKPGLAIENLVAQHATTVNRSPLWAKRDSNP